MQKSQIMALVAISVIAMASIAFAHGNAGFGEFAGQIIYNMSIGSNQTYYWTLVNYYNHTEAFYILPANLGKNTSSPIIKYSANCITSDLCVIPAANSSNGGEGTYQINLTVFIPLNQSIINHTFSAYATAYVPPVNPQTGIAQIQQGTAKLIEITAIQSTTTTSSSTSSSSTIPASTSIVIQKKTQDQPNYANIEYLILGGIAVICLIIGSYIMGKKDGKIKKKG